mmetsp:Transcript_12589/g.35368  ORF Transcript_12589/g.35368 Transcript_12589/m.35368 type:complete len:205 (+) Transcript_12589:1498-2112(+)
MQNLQICCVKSINCTAATCRLMLDLLDADKICRWAVVAQRFGLQWLLSKIVAFVVENWAQINDPSNPELSKHSRVLDVLDARSWRQVASHWKQKLDRICRHSVVTVCRRGCVTERIALSRLPHTRPHHHNHHHTARAASCNPSQLQLLKIHPTRGACCTAIRCFQGLPPSTLLSDTSKCGAPITGVYLLAEGSGSTPGSTTTPQ